MNQSLEQKLEKLHPLERAALELCWAIEELPASKQQTDLSVQASALRSQVGEHFNEAEEVGQRYAASERDGILMLIAHEREEWAKEDMQAAAALDNIHAMIRGGQHKPYVDAAICEAQEG